MPIRAITDLERGKQRMSDTPNIVMSEVTDPVEMAKLRGLA